MSTPCESSFVVDRAPLLGFKEILGLAPKLATICSIMTKESYSESAITATGLKARLFFTKSSWAVTTWIPLTFAAIVVSARGSSEIQSFMIWFL